MLQGREHGMVDAVEHLGGRVLVQHHLRPRLEDVRRTNSAPPAIDLLNRVELYSRLSVDLDGVDADQRHPRVASARLADQHLARPLERTGAARWLGVTGK